MTNSLDERLIKEGLAEGNADFIRRAEGLLKSPFKFVVRIQGVNYEVGSFYAREGQYMLVMNRTFENPSSGRTEDNPYIGLTGIYASYGDMTSAFESRDKRLKISERHGTIYPTVDWRGEGIEFTPLGKIVVPFLRKKEIPGIRILVK